MRDFRDRLADAPLYLSWVRQGKVWWGVDWLKTHGPVRERIPGFDDHVSFANYDLRLNHLPALTMTPEGRPYVSCLLPLSEAELADIIRQLSAVLRDRARIEEYLRAQVYPRLTQVRNILDVVHYHGFQPSERTPGIEYFERLFPRRDLRQAD